MTPHSPQAKPHTDKRLERVYTMSNTSTESMSFIVNRSAFNSALTMLAPSVYNGRYGPEILHNVEISADSRLGITLATTDLERFTVVTIPVDACTVVENGSFTVNYKELSSLIKSVQDEEVYFTRQDSTLLIEAASVHVSLLGMSADDYPAIPQVHDDKKRITPQSVTLPVETLRKMVTLTAYAAADDDSRPVLCSINIRLKAGKLTMAAADAFRLAICTEKTESPTSWDFDLLIPAKSLIALCKALPKAKKGYDPGNVILTCISTDFATFTHGDYTLYTRLIDGTFPNYERIVPYDARCIAEVDIPALKNALDTVKTVAKESSNITHFTVNGHIDVSASYEEKKLQVAVPATTTNNEGETTEVLFNYQYMLDFLTAHPKGTLQLELQGATKPGKVLFPDVPGFVGVIMPMHINR